MNEPKITQVRPGVWSFRFSDGTDPITGRRVQQRQTVRGTLDDARRELGRLQAEKALREHPSSAATFSQVRVLWDDVTRQTGRRRASTAAMEQAAYRNHLEGLIGDIPLSQLTPERITRAYDALSQSCSPPTIKRLHQQVSSILNWAYRRGYVGEVATSRVEVPRTRRPLPSAPTTEHVRDLLDSLAESQDLWLACRLAATVGLRRGEIVGLRLGDFDLESGTVRVDRSVTVEKGLRPKVGPTKTGDTGTATLALDGELVEAVTRRRSELRETALQTGRPLDDLFLISGHTLDEPARPDSLTRRLATHISNHPDAPRISLKELRRFVASTLVEGGIDIATAQLVLRHTDYATTARHYVAPRENLARRATITVGQLLSGKAG